MASDNIHAVMDELTDRFNELVEDGKVTESFANLGFHENEALCLFAAVYAMRLLEDRESGKVTGMIKVLPDEQSSDVAAAIVGGFILGLDYARRHGLPEDGASDNWEF